MQKTRTKKLILAAEFAAFLAVFSQLTIPLGVIPVTLQTFAIGLMASLSPVDLSLITLGTYYLLGLIGLPVFAGGHSGVGTFFGPTGGYLIGFVAYVLITSRLLQWQPRNSMIWLLIANLLGATVQLFCGALGLMIYQGLNLTAAIQVGVYPFVLAGLIKIAIIMGVVPALYARVAAFRTL